jgi:hypothetical protein
VGTGGKWGTPNLRNLREKFLVGDGGREVLERGKVRSNMLENGPRSAGRFPQVLGLTGGRFGPKMAIGGRRRPPVKLASALGKVPTGGRGGRGGRVCGGLLLFLSSLGFCYTYIIITPSPSPGGGDTPSPSPPRPPIR